MDIEMNKPGDIVTAFGHPLKKKYPIGEVQLVSKIKETEHLELWNIEFPNTPGKAHSIFIRKDNNGESKT